MNKSLKISLFLLAPFLSLQAHGSLFNRFHWRTHKKSVALVSSVGLLGNVLYHEHGWRKAQKQIAQKDDEALSCMACLGLRNPQLSGQLGTWGTDHPAFKEIQGYAQKRDKHYKFALTSRLLHGSMSDAVIAVDPGAIKVRVL